LIVGGKPPHSWPAFIPVSYELTILGAALFTVFGLFAFCGFPRPSHPLFNVPRFDRATQDRFFLCVKADDPAYDPVLTSRLLESLGPVGLFEAPA
jgi:hypothetical protein